MFRSFADLQGIEYLTAPPISKVWAPMSNAELRLITQRAARQRVDKAAQRAAKLHEIEKILRSAEAAIAELRKAGEDAPLWAIVRAEALGECTTYIKKG